MNYTTTANNFSVERHFDRTYLIQMPSRFTAIEASNFEQQIQKICQNTSTFDRGMRSAQAPSCLDARSLAEETSAGVDRGDFSGFILCCCTVICSWLKSPHPRASLLRRSTADKIICDFGQTLFMDNSGLIGLCQIIKLSQRTGVTLAFSKFSPQKKIIFSLTGLDKYLQKLGDF